jgi:Ca2+-binding RTX toxin-like protein
VVTAAAFGLFVAGAQSAWAEGVEGPAYKNPAAPSGTQSAFGNPTGSKPESKLWFHDNRWWAVMWDTATGDYHIFGLNASTNKWIDTGVTVDHRRTSRQDVVSDGNALYIASHRFAGVSEAVGSQALLRRFAYNSSTDKYVLKATGTINNVASETLVIAKQNNAAGTLWATWPQGPNSGPRDIKVARSNDNGRTWGNPTTLDTVPADDISSIVAFGNTVGVMWNDDAVAFRFAVRTGGAWVTETAYTSGADGADDHINLEAVGGQVYAAVKSSSPGASFGPLVLILRRDTAGNWTSYGVVNSRWSRPTVQINRTTDRLYVFANAAVNVSGQRSGTIFRKTALLSSLNSLANANATVFIQRGTGDNPGMVDATSAKSSVTSGQGVVVLASDEGTSHYWFRDINATSSPPPADTGPNVIRGTRAGELLVGTRRRDIIYGGGGNDRIRGRGGNDVIRGGTGRDRLVGGGGRDRLIGGRGRDTFIAKDGLRDVLKGGVGRDRARRDRGLDVLRSIEAIF